MLGVLGDLVEDVVVWLREPMRHATDTEASVHRMRGGSAANVAAFAGPLFPTRFLGCVGADDVGAWLAGELASHGVDVKAQRRGSTGTIVVLIDEHGERAMFPDRAAAALLDDVQEQWTEGLSHLHVPAYSFAVEPLGSSTVAVIRRVRVQGGTVSIDASSTGMLRQYGPQRFRDLLRALHPRLLFANRDEAECLEFIDASRNHATEADMPETTIIIKDGGRPTTVLLPGKESLRVPVPRRVDDVRDMTGAGDAFAAGFLAEFLRHPEPRRACEAGHALAARVLRAPGASLRAD